MIRPELNIILLSAKLNPSNKDVDALNNLVPKVNDWNYFVNTLIERGLSPLFYNKLILLSNQTKPPKEITEKLKKAYYKTLSRSLMLHDYYKNVATAFNANGVEFIALKGIYLSEWLYGDVGLRQFSDIDLLVKPQDAEKALSVLRSLGYKSFDGIESEEIGGQKDLMHYKPRILNDVSVEIHINVQHSKESYLMPIEELWANAVKTKIDGIDARVLSFYDQFIHLCVHLDKHVKMGHVQFTSFADITNIISVYENEFDWQQLLEKSRRYNCEAIVFKYVVLVHKYFNAPIPTVILKEYKHLLKPKDEKIFINYLRGIAPFKSLVPHHLEKLKEFSNISSSFKYLIAQLFPSKEFMIEKYGLKSKVEGRKTLQTFKPSNLQTFKLRFWWLWYPYRWAIGLRGLLKMISGKW